MIGKVRGYGVDYFGLPWWRRHTHSNIQLVFLGCCMSRWAMNLKMKIGLASFSSGQQSSCQFERQLFFSIFECSSQSFLTDSLVQIDFNNNLTPSSDYLQSPRLYPVWGDLELSFRHLIICCPPPCYLSCFFVFTCEAVHSDCLSRWFTTMLISRRWSLGWGQEGWYIAVQLVCVITACNQRASSKRCCQ